MKPIFWLRKAATFFSDNSAGFWPSMEMVPEVGCSNAPSRLRSVVLPEPLGPMTARF